MISKWDILLWLTYTSNCSSRESQQFIHIVRFYCKMFRLTYKGVSSGREETKNLLLIVPELFYIVLVYGWVFNLWVWKKTNCVKHFIGVTKYEYSGEQYSVNSKKTRDFNRQGMAVTSLWVLKFPIPYPLSTKSPTTDCFIAFLCPKINKAEIVI